MQSSKSLLLCGMLAGCAAVSYAQESPVLKGYITRATSASDFDVNGVRILCRAKAGENITPSRDLTVAVVDCPSKAPRLGDKVDIHYTVRNTTINAIYATRIEKQQAPSLGGVSGAAVIDATPTQEIVGGKATGLTVRADGYRIHITSKTSIDWRAPSQSLADVKVGDWIKYKGKIDATGVLVASSAQIGPNTIGGGEQRLRTKDDYDPSTISAGAKQNYLKDAVRFGFDPKKFPPFNDAAMQARVERIGNSLVPAYQRALPESDPAAIDFRFQLIDTKLLRDALTLSSGVILIPHQLAERMESDSQLAALLADGMARVLERQEYRTEKKAKTAYASIVLAVAVSPYAGVGSTVATEIEKRAQEQRGRVSLSLLQDAGYDISQAPIAWWLLAEEKPKPISDIEVPERSAYLYRILRETGKDWVPPVPVAH